MKGFSEWVKQVQRYKLPVIKLISPEHVTHGMVTRVSNTILYIWPLLRESDGCELGLEQWSFCNIYTYEIIMMYIITRAFQVVLEVKKTQLPKQEKWDMDSVPGSGRSPGAGHGNPLQYSCLENPKDRGAWWATVLKATKSQTWLKRHSTHAYQI